MVPISAEEKRWQMAERREEGRPAGMGQSVLLTLFQVLTAVQLVVAGGGEANVTIPLTFFVFTCVCWGYFIFMRLFRRIGFEMETIAFFPVYTVARGDGLDRSGRAAQAAHRDFDGHDDVPHSRLFLRDLTRAQKVRWFMGATAVGLLAITLLIGSSEGRREGMAALRLCRSRPRRSPRSATFSPVRRRSTVCSTKRNLWMFIGLTGVCGGCLALQNDFGTALVFFVTFLVIAYLRSGDFATLGLVCAGLLRRRHGHADHQAARCGALRVVGHIWEDVYDKGFQQTHTLTAAAASGGLIGVGAGKGWLSGLPAADTDIVFGMLCEEWGLVIAVLTVLCIITLAVFAVRACRAEPFELYTIAACAATSLLVFQTCLNVFGAVDILPFTGVTPAVRVQRRLVHAVGMGHARLPQGDRHPSERFVRGAPAKPPRAERGGLSHA